MEDNKKDKFKFKKEFGQNFIFDTNFLKALIRDFNLESSTNVLEIGAGMGTLTSCLAENFKKVISFEIDKTLIEHLKEIENKYSNLNFVFMDILQKDVKEIETMFNNESFCMIANLPYYITSQIIFKFLFDSKNLKSMFVMVQKEVGERYCAKPCNKEYGIPTVLLNTFGDCKIVKIVGKHMFTPIPKIDSCVIQIDINKSKFDIKDCEKYQKFISNCFKMKRKTLVNNLVSSGIKKDVIISALDKMQLRLDARPETLTPEQFVLLFNILFS